MSRGRPRPAACTNVDRKGVLNVLPCSELVQQRLAKLAPVLPAIGNGKQRGHFSNCNRKVLWIRLTSFHNCGTAQSEQRSFALMIKAKRRPQNVREKPSVLPICIFY